MGNTQSRILGSVYYVAYSLSALITLVCLFNIPRSQVFLVVQPVHAQAPTITADGTPITTMGTTGTFGFLTSAKLDSSQSVVLINDFSNGPLLASAAPYAFDKRTTGSVTSMCTFDGNEVSSPSTSNIYCRRSAVTDTFFAFKYSDLSAVQDGSSNNPLYAAASTNLGTNGMLTVVGSFMFVASGQADSKLYRVDISTLTYTSPVTTTKSAQDTSAATETYHQGACDSNGFCYAFSTNKRLAKFTQDTSGSPTYVDALDLSQSGQLDSGSVACGDCINVALDSAGNNLLVATTQTAYNIAKINLGTFAYVSKVTLTTPGFIGASAVYLCENCFTAGIGGETYMMVMSYTSTKDARFIKISDMTEVTDAGTFINTADAVTGWLTTTPGAGHGGIVFADDAGVQKLTTTGVVGTTSTTTTTTTATSTTTTSTPAPGNNNQQQQQGSSSDQGVVVIATTGSILAVILIAGVGFIIYKFGFASSSASETSSAEPTSSNNNNEEEELKEVK